ncbi:MAG: DUF2461 domain-containing protein [Bacteroidota bacterium]
MDFQNLFSFLEELQRNNHKEWMDANRKWYHELRNAFIAWLDSLDEELLANDKDYYPTPGKKGINRINNNLMFHPNKPVYKDHFGAGLDKAPKSADYYIHIGVEECFLAGGFWRPDPKALRNLRDGIDYNGEELKAILQKPSFQKTFGGLFKDDCLRNAPKGFSNDHPHIDLLKNKSFAVTTPLNRETVLGVHFEQKVLEVYYEMLPFRRYLNRSALL